MDEKGALNKSISGGKWMFISTLFQRVLSIGTFFVLAHLLTPNDFGIMAIALLVPPLFDLALTIDFDSALIQSKYEDPLPYFNALWTLNILRSLIIFFTVYLAGGFIATFFHADQASLLIRLGGLFILIQGFGNVAQLLFFKEMDFKKIFIRDAAARIAYSIVAIFFAWYLRSYWALFLAQGTLYLVGTLIAYYLYPFRPKFTLRFERLRHLISYSKWLYVQSALGEFAATLESAIIGRLMGPTDVGFYTRAKSLASTPTSPLISLINKVGFSAYSRIQDSPEKIKDGYLKTLNILFFVAVPFSILVLREAPRLILIAMGSSWIGLANLFQILVVASIFQIISSTSAPLFNAIGLPKYAFKINIIYTISLSILLFVLTILYGTIGTATSILVASIFISTMILMKLHRLIHINTREILSSFFVPLMNSLFTFALGSEILTRIALNDLSYMIFFFFCGIAYLMLTALAGIVLHVGPYPTLKIVVQELNIYWLVKILP